jgi:hypothetical protein
MNSVFISMPRHTQSKIKGRRTVKKADRCAVTIHTWERGPCAWAVHVGCARGPRTQMQRIVMMMVIGAS